MVTNQSVCLFDRSVHLHPHHVSSAFVPVLIHMILKCPQIHMIVHLIKLLLSLCFNTIGVWVYEYISCGAGVFCPEEAQTTFCYYILRMTEKIPWTEVFNVG